MTTRRDDESLVVAISGTVDGRAAADLHRRLLDLIDEAQYKYVTVDLCDVKLLTLEGVSPLHAAYWRATGAGSSFGVVAPHHPVRSVLMLASIDWLMPVYASRQEAVDDAMAESTDFELAA